MGTDGDKVALKAQYKKTEEIIYSETLQVHSRFILHTLSTSVIELSSFPFGYKFSSSRRDLHPSSPSLARNLKKKTQASTYI